jgi:acylphosphatase
MGLLPVANGILAAMKKLHPFDQVETVSAMVTGRVQGVGFRAAAVRQAHSMKITGWVRNNSDGSVEALLQGPHDAIDRMLSWLLMGPPAARVDQVDTNEVITERRFDRFEQI